MSSSTGQSNAGIWGAWYDSAKEFAAKAQEMAESAGKVAQETAAELAKKAEDMRQNYDFDKATSILMGTVGGPIDTSVPTGERRVAKKKSLKQALEEMDMVYVTENLVSMAFPYDYELASNQNKVGNDIDVAAALLRKRHAGHFMVWNVSEEPYNYSKFADQVLEYKFPGHPAPPLGLLFKICTSVESWLDADERNIAVVHCLTGKGRTAALLACILAWIGEFSSPMEALQYVSERRKISVDYLTIPSQRRYIQYFSNMLDGVKPRSEPLLLRRIIINSIPIFGTETEGDESTQGCCPYLQLFKNGRLIATAAPLAESHHDGTNPNTSAASQQQCQLRWIKASEGSASFTLDTPIQGDILLRCRHAAKSGARVSMFRCGFHTGYVPSGVLRLTKAQLDGSSSDQRYDDEFFIDLIFAPILAASNISPDAINTSSSVPKDPAASSTSTTTNSRSNPASASDSGLSIDATSTDKYEQSLHKDTKFWESISTRKQRAKRRKSRKFLSNQQEQFSIMDDGAKLFDTDDSTSEISFLTAQYSSSGGFGAGSGTTVGLGSASSSSSSSGGTALERDASAGGGVGGGGSGASGLSDMDLIMQLAQAEGEEEDAVSAGGAASSTGGGPLSNSHMSSGVLTGGTISEQGTDSDDYAQIGGGGKGDLEHAANRSNSASLSDNSVSSPESRVAAPTAAATTDGIATVTEATPAPAPTPAVKTTDAAPTTNTKSNSELQALEDLERELGLDLFSGASTATGAASASGAGGSAASGANTTSSSSSSSGVGEDLDELEKYLQSFSTK